MERQISAMFHSIVMPAYNEEEVLRDTIEVLCSELDQSTYQYEIIIVDDNSSDRTGTIAAEISTHRDNVSMVRNTGPNGYGFAIRMGLDIYTGDSVVVVTSDGSDSAKDILAYWSKIEAGYECAFGDRFIDGSVVEGYPVVKRLINRLANHMLGWFIGTDYRDITNGFKCYQRHVIDNMSPIISGQFNITIELALKAMLAGHRYAVVPTDWRQRDGGQSSFDVLKLIKPYLATMAYCISQNYIKSIKRN